MSSNEATSRPWHAHNNCVYADDGFTMLVTAVAGSHTQSAQDAANAALIVRAVNSHDALVEAVRNLRIALVRCADKGESPRGQVAQHAIEMADAALKALAEMREAR